MKSESKLVYRAETGKIAKGGHTQTKAAAMPVLPSPPKIRKTTVKKPVPRVRAEPTPVHHAIKVNGHVVEFYSEKTPHTTLSWNEARQLIDKRVLGAVVKIVGKGVYTTIEIRDHETVIVR